MTVSSSAFGLLIRRKPSSPAEGEKAKPEGIEAVSRPEGFTVFPTNAVPAEYLKGAKLLGVINGISVLVIDLPEHIQPIEQVGARNMLLTAQEMKTLPASAFGSAEWHALFQYAQNYFKGNARLPVVTTTPGCDGVYLPGLAA